MTQSQLPGMASYYRDIEDLHYRIKPAFSNEVQVFCLVINYPALE